MISADNIQNIVNQAIENTEYFLVDVLVKPGNRISVFVDKLEGITINECADISRDIEKHLDRDIEDFELEVSSPGLTQPLKVKQQYFKNIGKDVEIVLVTGTKLIGKMLQMNNDGITIETQKKTKISGQKKPEISIENVFIEFKNIKTTKVSLNF